MDLMDRNGEYRLCLERMGFRVQGIAPLNVEVTRSDGRGRIAQEVRPVTEVNPGYSSTVLDVWNWDGSGWRVDYEAGALRWSGWKANRAVWNALYRLGFRWEQIQAAMRHARRRA